MPFDTTMTYHLLIADKSYSSWSLRGWLCFAAFDIPVQVQTTRMYCPQFATDLAEFSAAQSPSVQTRTVPIVRTPGGGLLTDSIAIAWHLATAFPDHRLLPENPVARADALSIIAEMHSGFTGIRGACPMNLRTSWRGFTPNGAVLADIERIEHLWSRAFAAHGGPWICGDYSLADVFFAPLATRIATYDLPVSAMARSYVSRHLTDSKFMEWRQAGLTEGADQPAYDMALQRQEFPSS